MRNGQNEIVFDRYPLSILLLAAIGAKLIGPHGGLQVDKQKVLSSNGLRGITPVKFFCDCFELLDKRFIGDIPRECHPEKRPK